MKRSTLTRLDKRSSTTTPIQIMTTLTIIGIWKANLGIGIHLFVICVIRTSHTTDMVRRIIYLATA